MARCPILEYRTPNIGPNIDCLRLGRSLQFLPKYLQITKSLNIQYTGCHIYNIVKYSVHQNVVKYKIPPNTKYAAKRPNFTKYQTPPNMQLNATKYCEQQRTCWKCVKRHSNPNCVSNHKRRLIGGLQISSFH